MSDLSLGFTGTQSGFSASQRRVFFDLLREFDPAVFHHGCCVGADAHAHNAVRWECGNGRLACLIVGHPGTDVNGESPKRAVLELDEVWPTKPYLTRNRDIVAECDVLVAAPGEFVERKHGSGTWATVRYARKAGRPLVIIWPDGTTSRENFDA